MTRTVVLIFLLIAVGFAQYWQPYGGYGPYARGPYFYRRPYYGYYGRPYGYPPPPPPPPPPYAYGGRGFGPGLFTGLLLG